MRFVPSASPVHGFPALGASLLVALLLAAAPAPPVASPASAGAGACALDEVTDLAAKLRDPALAPAEREAVEERLLALGEPGARALQRYVEESSRKVDEHAKRTQKTYLTGLARAAKRTVGARTSRAVEAEIEKLRATVNALRQATALTPVRIVAEGDPARERLAELLWVGPSQALEKEDELASERDSLRADVDGLEREYALWKRCNDALPEGKRSKSLASPGVRWFRFEAEERWTCVLATPMSDSDRELLEENRAIAAELEDPEEAAGIEDLNRLRILLGLHALAIDLQLCFAARDHSRDMKRLGFFAHESPVEGKKTPGERAARFNTSASGENIAAGQETGAGANLAWWHSPGHHKNMLGGYARVGLGHCEGLWTQMFG